MQEKLHTAMDAFDRDGLYGWAAAGQMSGNYLAQARSSMIELASRIQREIVRARKTIENAHAGLIRVSERDTIQKLVMPMLAAIGWDTLDLTEVREELQSSGGGRADIACFTGGRVVMFTEAKAINDSIDDPRFISQAMKYGTDEGANWCVLTNGRIWAIYHANAEGKAADKLFRRFDITDLADESVAIDSLSLLAKSAMEDREIDRAWQRDHADRRVEAALRTLLSGDPAFITLIRKRIQADHVDLAPRQIREALARLDLRVGSRLPGERPGVWRSPDAAPSSPQPIAEPRPAQPPAASSQPQVTATEGAPGDWKDVKISHLIDAGLIRIGDMLRIKGSSGSEARILDGRRCNYLGVDMTYGQWGCRVKNWTAIQIAVHAETMDGVLLQQLREKLAARR